MTLYDLLYIIKRKLHVVIFVTTVFIIISALYSVYLVVPVYKSITTFRIKISAEQNINEYNRMLTAMTATNAYSVVIKGDTVANNIAKIVRSDLTPAKVKSMIKVENISNTDIIKATVQSDNAKLSSDVANAIPGAATDVLKRAYNIDSIEQIDVAKIAPAPDPYINRNILLAAFLGIVISLCFIISIEFFDTTIKTEEDVREKLGMNVLAMLPVIKNTKKKKRK